MQSKNLPGNTAVSSYAPDTAGTNVRAMSVATSLFFMWGFLTSLNDTLIPHLKSVFDLDYTRAMLVQFAFFSSYFVFAFPAGKVIEWVGYKRTMVVGLATMTAGALLFIPASRVPSFGLFLAALIVLAAGITVLQVAANPYVANLGPQATASSRLNLAQAFNSFGTFLAPIFGGYLILSRLPKLATSTDLTGAALHAQRLQQASRVDGPYLGIASFLSSRNLRLSRRSIQDLLDCWCIRLGLPFSHIHATNAVNQGISALVLKWLAGHQSFTALFLYPARARRRAVLCRPGMVERKLSRLAKTVA